MSISEEALQGISEEVERLGKALEASEFKRKLLQGIAKDLAQRVTDLMSGYSESHEEVKKRLLLVEEEGEACRMWMSDAEKRLDRIEDTVKRFADHMQGQAKYGTPPLSADGVNTAREKA